MTSFKKIYNKIKHQPKNVRAKDFVKLLLKEGFVMRDGDLKKSHRHFFHPQRAELMVVVVFSEGDNTVLNENYVKKYLKEIFQ